MAGNAARTARARRGPSAPARYLVESGLVPEGASVLDYGCGKGADTRAYGWSGWDPNHRDNLARGSRREGWSTVVCNYVANVLNAEERQDLYEDLLATLSETGEAWIAVRRDKPEEASGFTSIGTFQDFGVDVVEEAPEGALAEHWHTEPGRFTLYRLTNNPEG